MAPIPGDIRECIDKTVPRPHEVRTKKQLVELVARLKQSEESKTLCGRRLIRLYEEHRDLLKDL